MAERPEPDAHRIAPQPPGLGRGRERSRPHRGVPAVGRLFPPTPRRPSGRPRLRPTGSTSRIRLPTSRSRTSTDRSASLAALRGQPALLLLWSASAAPAQAALRDLASHQAELTRAGASVLAVALDPPAELAKVQGGGAGAHRASGGPRHRGGRRHLLDPQPLPVRRKGRPAPAHRLPAERGGGDRQGLPGHDRRRAGRRGHSGRSRRPPGAPRAGRPLRGDVLHGAGHPQLPPVRPRAGRAGVRGAGAARVRAGGQGRSERLHALQPRDPLHEGRATRPRPRPPSSAPCR